MSIHVHGDTLERPRIIVFTCDGCGAPSVPFIVGRFTAAIPFGWTVLGHADERAHLCCECRHDRHYDPGFVDVTPAPVWQEWAR